MGEPGFVYVLVNPSMEGLVKVGRTQSDPMDRAVELSSVTGVPTPFILVYYSFFLDCNKAEEYVHELLESKKYRVSESREFFCAPIKEVIDTVIHAVRNFGGDAIEATSHVSSVEVDMHPGDFSPWLDIYKLASKVHFGSDDTLADIDEAIDLYRRAAKLGSPPACLRLGEIYSSQEGFVNKREAIRWFREGAKREVNDCYAELSFMFANTELNFEISKCWRKYFDSLDTEDWSVDRPANKTLHFMRYLWQVKKGDTNGEHLSLLSRERDDLLQWCERRVRRLREDGTAPFVAQRDLALVRLMLFPEVPFEMMYGNIKWVDEGREYGFITGSDGKDYYLAFRLLAYLEPQNNPNGSGRLKLEKRMPVFFEYGDLDDGPAVTGVRLDVSSW